MVPILYGFEKITYVNNGNVKHHFRAHTADYGLVPYIPMILQYYEILAYYYYYFSSFIGTLKSVVLRSMLGLFYDETYGAMTNYDDRDNNRNKDRNDDDNATSISGSYGPIFDPIMALLPWGTMYLCVGIYIYPIKTLLKMCNKLLHAKLAFWTSVTATRKKPQLN